MLIECYVSKVNQIDWMQINKIVNCKIKYFLKSAKFSYLISCPLAWKDKIVIEIE